MTACYNVNGILSPSRVFAILNGIDVPIASQKANVTVEEACDINQDILSIYWEIDDKEFYYEFKIICDDYSEEEESEKSWDGENEQDNYSSYMEWSIIYVGNIAFRNESELFACFGKELGDEIISQVQERINL